MADLGEVVRLQPQTDGLLVRFEGRDLPTGDDAVEAVDQRRLQKGLRQPANEVVAGRHEDRFAAMVSPVRVLLQIDVRQQHQAAFGRGAAIAPRVDALLQVAFELAWISSALEKWIDWASSSTRRSNRVRTPGVLLCRL